MIVSFYKEVEIHRDKKTKSSQIITMTYGKYNSLHNRFNKTIVRECATNRIVRPIIYRSLNFF